MNPVRIEDVLGSRGRVAVLRVLANVDVPLSIRQIASQAGLSHAAAGDALDSLVNAGVVGATEAGRSRVHWLERRSIAVRDLILPVFEAESEQSREAITELRSAIPSDAYSVVLFGSRARGDSRPDSDYDVLVVEPDAESLDRTLGTLDAVAFRMRTTLGAGVSVLGYTLSQARELASEPGSFMEGVVDDAITLAGVAPRNWGNGSEATTNRAGGA